MPSKAIEHEKKILRDLVEQLGDPGETMRKQAVMRRLLFGLGYGGLLAGFVLAMGSLLHPFAIAVICAVSGAALGFGVFLRFAKDQWPITKRHVDLDSVKRRLAELEALEE